jgi:cystathionine beta-lyase/cystathionine gamma-synthase
MTGIKKDGHIISINNVYGNTIKIFNYEENKMGVTTTYISENSIEELKNAIQENTTLIYLETPSSNIFSIQDIEEVVKIAKEHGIKTVIDNTYATPIFQKPLKMGVDLEVHSCSKYLGGHSDLIAGVVIGSKEDIESIYVNESYSVFGAKMAPFDAWLLTRSLRTLPIRMKQHNESGMTIAKYLETHPKVKKVLYPGLESFEGYEVAKKQMTGFGGLMSFELKTENIEEIKAFVNELEYFSLGVSWGGHESLVYVPAISYSKIISKEQFEKTGVKWGVIRISVGLEEAENLIEDLENAFKKIK